MSQSWLGRPAAGQPLGAIELRRGSTIPESVSDPEPQPAAATHAVAHAAAATTGRDRILITVAHSGAEELALEPEGTSTAKADEARD